MSGGVGGGQPGSPAAPYPDYDYRQRAISIFDASLEFARRFDMPVVRGNYWVDAALPNGRFLLTSPGMTRLPGKVGVAADTSFIILTSPDGAAVDTIGAFRVAPKYVDARGYVRPSFFQPRGGAFVVGAGVGWMDGGPIELTIGDSLGRPVRIIRKSTPQVPVTSAMIDEFKRAYLELLGQNPEAPQDQIRRMLDEAPYASVLPAISPGALVDALGYLWVPRYHFEGTVATQWEVFDTTGAWTGTVATPPGLAVHQIGPDELIGVRTGEFDVPYVAVYSLRR